MLGALAEHSGTQTPRAQRALIVTSVDLDWKKKMLQPAANHLRGTEEAPDKAAMTHLINNSKSGSKKTKELHFSRPVLSVYFKTELNI